MLGTTRLVLRTFFAALLATSLVASTVLVASPASAQKIRPKFWGMHAGDWVKGPKVPVGAANFTASRTYWRYVEVAPGEYDWSRLDAQVFFARKQGAQPMIVLGQTPRFHSTRPRGDHYHAAMPKKNAWRKWVRAVANRYGAKLDYQIWPEPNIIQNWTGSPRQMAKLTMIASKEIRKASRGAKVVSPAVALRLEQQQRWTMRYFRQKVGGKRVHRYIDAVAIDPFPFDAQRPEHAHKLMTTIKRKLRRIGVRKQIWVNEINYGVPTGGAKEASPFRMNVQQAYVIRTYALAAAAGMKRTYWLGWFRAFNTSVHMVNKKGRPAQPAKSYKQVRRWLNKTWVRGCNSRRDGLWTCTAVKRKNNGKKEIRRIHWHPTGVVRIQTPKSTKRWENQEGGIRRKKGRRTLRIDYRPVMVASRR